MAKVFSERLEERLKAGRPQTTPAAAASLNCRVPGARGQPGSPRRPRGSVHTRLCPPCQCVPGKPQTNPRRNINHPGPGNRGLSPCAVKSRAHAQAWKPSHLAPYSHPRGHCPGSSPPLLTNARVWDLTFTVPPLPVPRQPAPEDPHLQHLNLREPFTGRSPLPCVGSRGPGAQHFRSSRQLVALAQLGPSAPFTPSAVHEVMQIFSCASFQPFPGFLGGAQNWLTHGAGGRGKVRGAGGGGLILLGSSRDSLSLQTTCSVCLHCSGLLPPAPTPKFSTAACVSVFSAPQSKYSSSSSFKRVVVTVQFSPAFPNLGKSFGVTFFQLKTQSFIL